MGTAHHFGDMPEYRRMIAPGGTFFLTLVTYARRPLFRDGALVALLRATVAQIRGEHPFELRGAVVMPDHIHLLCELPDGDADYSTRMGLIKARFTRAFLAAHAVPEPVCTSRLRHPERSVWQRRFWEHTIRDDDDFAAHLEYIHYNPVKHGWVSCPHAWPYSSFSRWVREGRYPADWQCRCAAQHVMPSAFDHIARTVGE